MPTLVFSTEDRGVDVVDLCFQFLEDAAHNKLLVRDLGDGEVD